MYLYAYVYSLFVVVFIGLIIICETVALILHHKKRVRAGSRLMLTDRAALCFCTVDSASVPGFLLCPLFNPSKHSIL